MRALQFLQVQRGRAQEAGPLRRAEQLKFSKIFVGVPESRYFTQTNHFCFMNIPLKMNPLCPFLVIRA